MRKALINFCVCEEGQDLVEYTLLIALVALGSVSLMKTQGASISPIWGSASTLVNNAATVASS